MSLTLYIATTNQGKVRDFAIADQTSQDVNYRSLPGIEHMPAPAEDQTTFEGNARLKAIYYSRLAPGLLVLADDSGLEVDALDGRPGVRSARFAVDLAFGNPEDKLDDRNNEALLLEMLEQTQRSGRYRCALALARGGQVLQTADGALEGVILTEAAGTGGFGYDPLFFVPELGCTMAEASPADRLEHSHRGRALRSLLQHLPDGVR